MPKITHRKKRLSSFKLIVLGFAGVIVLGALILMLPHGLSESEILCEIRRFRETHGNVDIILFDGQKNDF